MNENNNPDEEAFVAGIEAGENELGALLSEDVGEVDTAVTDEGSGGETPPAAPVVQQPVVPAATPTPAPVTPAAATSPVVTPGAAPVVPTPVAATTPPVVAAPQSDTSAVQPAVQPPTPAATEQPQQDPAVLARETFQRFRGEAEAKLANEHYKLPQDVVDRFGVGDFSDIPKMMAKVYLDAYTAAVAHINNHFPNMLESTTQVQTTHAKNEETFFQAWPQLNMAEHGADIKRFGQSYRQMYPQATPEEFIRDVGAQVIVARKITAGGQAPQVPANGGAPPATPAAQPKAFTPASGRSGGSPPPSQSKPANKNPFEQLAEDVDELDLD